MRILVHDYAGHPFQPQLSRELAGRGHTVLHAYCGSIEAPPGCVAPRANEPVGFELHEVRLSQRIRKHSFWSRWQLEIECGRRLEELVDRFRPDVVLSGNTPLEAQARLHRRCRERGVSFVFWVHDVYSVAVHAILRKKIPVAGELIGRHYLRMERRLLRHSDAVVVVSEDFRPIMERWGISAGKLHVIENWAVLDGVRVRPKQNDWARRHKLDDKRCIIYSGVLGMKHNPALLAELAASLRDDERLVVISEGPGAEWLQAKALRNLVVLPFQPFEQLPDVLATGDVLLAVLRPEASQFSVPSKVLTYLCAGRALLLAVPAENLAARIVTANHAGLVVPPDDSAALAEAARRLAGDDELRAEFGRNARRYAEQQFAIGPITDRFEVVLRPTRAS